MPLLPFLLSLAAAFLHAGWNLLVKSSPDRLVGAWVVSAGAGLLNVAVLAVVGLPDRRVWWLILASATVQTFYMVLLATAYSVGDLAFVYPVARGSAPLLVTVMGVVLLGDRLTPLGFIGVIVVTVGIATLALGRENRSGVWWALATGLMIATYLLIDAAAVRSEGSAVTVLALEFVVHGLMLTIVALINRGWHKMWSAVRSRPQRALVGGVGSAASYLLVMSATLLAPVGLVSSIRESSVVLGVLAGRRLLAERVTPLQLTAAAATVLGVGVIALS